MKLYSIMMRRCLNYVIQHVYRTTTTSVEQPEQTHTANIVDIPIPPIPPITPIMPIQWKDCIPFVPPIVSGYVIKVYDGDTITIAAKLPYPESPLYRFPVRLNGIDTPEIKGKDEDEKKSALLAKHALENLILNKTVLLKNTTTEKYGRILADVYLDDLHLNQWMLDNKYAVPYSGGTKKSPESWTKYNKQRDQQKQQT